jgi:DNA-binding CsgD family transcriptional regulator
MTPRAVAVIHRERLAGEGIAVALGQLPGIVVMGAASSIEDGERIGRTADAVALDGQIAGAGELAARLRQAGVRVVVVGPRLANEEGVVVSSGAAISTLAAALAPGWDLSPSSIPLTERQRQILGMVAQGMPAKQVARHLNISPKTVEQHKARIFERLGVPNQTAAVSLVLRGGLGVAAGVAVGGSRESA